MNGTHLISKTEKHYNILGKGPLVDGIQESTPTMSIVCLVHGRRYQRIEDIRKIAIKKYPDVIFILSRDDEFPYNEILSQYLNIRLMFFNESEYNRNSYGSLINAAIAESQGKYVIVIRNGMELQIPPSHSINASVLCHVPLILDVNKSSIPSIYLPTQMKRGEKDTYIEPFSEEPSEDNAHTLFPYDYLGLYNKSRFENIGGYSEEIKNTYWQKLEFGYRSWLWGEKFVHLPGFCVEYSEHLPIDDKTVDKDYLRFYFRTIAVSYLSDHAQLAHRKFWKYYRARRGNILSALREFKEEQKWVQAHTYHYKYDIEQLIHIWGEE